MQMRALLFVAILTSGITDAMEAVEKAVATALGLTGAFSLPPNFFDNPAVLDHEGSSGMLSCCLHHQCIYGWSDNALLTRQHVMQALVCGTYQGAVLPQTAASLCWIKALNRSLCATCTAQLNTTARLQVHSIR